MLTTIIVALTAIGVWGFGFFAGRAWQMVLVQTNQGELLAEIALLRQELRDGRTAWRGSDIIASVSRALREGHQVSVHISAEQSAKEEAWQ